MIGFRKLSVVGVLTLGLAGLGLANSSGSVASIHSSGAICATTNPSERHPQIHKALHDLREAKQALIHAKHDFNGHRQAALTAAETAIKECEACLKADEK